MIMRRLYLSLSLSLAALLAGHTAAAAPDDPPKAGATRNPDNVL